MAHEVEPRHCALQTIEARDLLGLVDLSNHARSDLRSVGIGEPESCAGAESDAAPRVNVNGAPGGGQDECGAGNGPKAAECCRNSVSGSAGQGLKSLLEVAVVGVTPSKTTGVRTTSSGMSSSDMIAPPFARAEGGVGAVRDGHDLGRAHAAGDARADDVMRRARRAYVV